MAIADRLGIRMTLNVGLAQPASVTIAARMMRPILMRPAQQVASAAKDSQAGRSHGLDHEHDSDVLSRLDGDSPRHSSVGDFDEGVVAR
jgi:hypothetical protein